MTEQSRAKAVEKEGAWAALMQYKLSFAAAVLVILALLVAGLTQEANETYFHALFHGTATHILSVAVLTFILERALRLETHKMFEETLTTVLDRREPMLGNFIARACSSAATELFNRLPALPAQLFPSSKQPDPNFNKAFWSLLSNSGFYYIKGSKACHASWRLCRLNQGDAARLVDINILVLDPTDDDLIKAHAELTLRHLERGSRENAILSKMHEIRIDIYLTVLALAQHAKCQAVLYLHRDYAFFRCELFHDGLFLSFYSRGDPFPGSYLYPSDSSVYSAYNADIFHHRKEAFGRRILPLSAESTAHTSPNLKLKALLKSLGCQETIEVLNKLLAVRFDEYDALHKADLEQRS